ncbi:iron transporter [Rhodomicrobium sp.]|uniref:iron transporter n=1 Tax=Rhodomicrobium sp. TaxID=2720632 RepID=UPI0039E5A552
MKKLACATAALLLGATGAALAAEEFKEYPIGEAQKIGSLEVGAVYLAPIDMDPSGIDLPASQADVHLEADIKATEGNPNGFGAGEWIPNLTVSYRLENKDTGKVQSGNFMPMVAVDGPHYGSNVKFSGAGNYKLSYHVEPPSRQGFGRHTDKASGVGKWFEPFDVAYDFTFVPLK